MKRPLIIGITGGIGGGKSTLAAALREKGFYVYDTDKEAKRLQNENPLIRQKLIELFGKEIYNTQGLDRKKLANLVFEDRNLLTELNNIVHPALREDFFNWINKNAIEKYLFVESAIMLETGFKDFVDKIIVITAPEHIRIERVMKRDEITSNQVLARIAKQLPEEEKIKIADIVLNSDGECVLENNIQKVLSELDKLETPI